MFRVLKVLEPLPGIKIMWSVSISNSSTFFFGIRLEKRLNVISSPPSARRGFLRILTLQNGNKELKSKYFISYLKQF